MIGGSFEKEIANFSPAAFFVKVLCFGRGYSGYPAYLTSPSYLFFIITGSLVFVIILWNKIKIVFQALKIKKDFYSTKSKRLGEIVAEIEILGIKEIELLENAGRKKDSKR